MKTLIFCALPVVLLASSTAMPDGMINPIANLGAVAALSFITIWHTVKTFPMIHRLHREDSEKLRQTLDRLATSCQGAVDRLDRKGGD